MHQPPQPLDAAARRFEYGILLMRRDTDQAVVGGKWVEECIFYGPGQDAPVSFDTSTSLGVLLPMNHLGSAGWELLGPPEVTRFVNRLNGKTQNTGVESGVWQADWGDWFQKRYLFKRRVS